MNKFLLIIVSCMAVFPEIHSANKFTIESVKKFPRSIKKIPSKLDEEQALYINNIVSQQGDSPVVSQSNSNLFPKFKNEFINGKQKVSFNADDSIPVSLELDVLDRVSYDRIETIMNIVENHKEYVRYSTRRNILSMMIKVENNSLTVLLSNGESDEGTIFSIDL